MQTGCAGVCLWCRTVKTERTLGIRNPGRNSAEAADVMEEGVRFYTRGVRSLTP